MCSIFSIIVCIIASCLKFVLGFSFSCMAQHCTEVSFVLAHFKQTLNGTTVFWTLVFFFSFLILLCTSPSTTYWVDHKKKHNNSYKNDREKKHSRKKRSDDTSIVQYLCFVTHIIRFFYDCFFVQNFNDRNEQNKTGIKAPLWYY